MASAAGPSKGPNKTDGKYSDVDEYGFRRGKDFDFKSYENFISEYISVLSRRKSRWDQFLKNGKKTKIKLDAKVKRFCRKGIPMEHRQQVWMKVSGAQKSLEQHPGLYQALLTKNDGSSKDQDLISSIKTDLERTFPDNVYFQSSRKRPDCKLQSLERVLLAIGRHKSEIGYCQGMNYIAALLLLVLDNEESVFWLFVTVLDNFLPDYYSSTMAGLRTDMEVLGVLVKERFPAVASCLERESVNWLLLSSKWFICIYADILPTETVLRIWDCFFTEGPKIMFRVALQLIELKADEVRKAEDMPALISTFQNIGKEDLAIECHHFMEECFKEETPLRMSRIRALRETCKAQIEREDREARERRKMRQQQ